MSTLTLNTGTTEQDTFDFDLEALAEKALNDQIIFDEAKANAESSKAAFRKALEDSGKLNPDFKGTSLVRTIVKNVSRFDPKKAVELLNAEEISQCSALSGTLVKANVAPSVYALMQSPGTTSLQIKVSD